jgi:hypothetical protein
MFGAGIPFLVRPEGTSVTGVDMWVVLAMVCFAVAAFAVSFWISVRRAGTEPEDADEKVDAHGATDRERMAA